MRRLLLALLLSGCEVGRPAPAEPRPPVEEQNACARLCERLGDCAIAPVSCAAGCARDQAKLRPGVQAAFTTCLEAQLARCETRSVPERRQLVSLCWTATLEAWSQGPGKEAIESVVRAVCGQAARCEPGAAPIDECVATLGKKMAGSPQGKTLAVARADLIERVTTCVGKASCAEPHPVAMCSELPEENP